MNPFRKVIADMKHRYFEMGYGSGLEFTNRYIDAAKPGTVVLDAGCGSGSIRELLGDEIRYIGVDINIGSDAPGYRGWEHKPDVVADLHELPLMDSSCDIVLLLQVLEHSGSPGKLLAEIFRVMKPGGRLYVSVPFVHWVHHKPHDYFRYTRYGLVRVLEDAGFTIITITASGGYFRTLLSVLSRYGAIYEGQSLQNKVFLFPLLGFLATVKTIIKVFEYPLDLLDREQELTTGYLCIAEKKR